MAQNRSLQWQDDDLTELLNRRLVGILQPGVYRGFDVQPFDASMDFTFVHTSGNGSSETDYSIPPVSIFNIGVILSRQGVIIKENAPITLTIAPNPSGLERVDRIVCRSRYVKVQGGQPSTYSVYTGTPGGGAPPFSWPAEEINLGLLYVPPGCTSLNDPGVRWRPANRPDLGGDQTVVHNDRQNLFRELITFQELALGQATVQVDAVNHNTVIVDTGSGDDWVEANASVLTVDIVDPVRHMLNAIQLRYPNNRLLALRFNNPGNAEVYLDRTKFLTSTLQESAPYTVNSTLRRSLRVYHEDTVMVYHMGGGVWDILSVTSGMNARMDRRLTLFHSLVWHAGGEVQQVGSDSYFDWKCNIIHLTRNAPYTLSNLIAAQDEGAGPIQEVIKEGYELQVVPRYSGGNVDADQFLVAPGGNILTHHGGSVALPWGRPATFIAVPSDVAGQVQWMLKDYVEGVEQDITAAFIAGNCLGDGDLNPITVSPAASNKVYLYFQGVRMHLRGNLRVGTNADFLSFKLPVPGRVKPTSYAPVGHGVVSEVDGVPTQSRSVLFINNGTGTDHVIAMVTGTGSPPSPAFPVGSGIRFSIDVELVPSR